MPDRSWRSNAGLTGRTWRMDSMVSPTNSTRTGLSAPAGNQSTMPPRTQNSPCSSTGSSRVNPASASRSPRATGSRSMPGFTSTAAASRCRERSVAAAAPHPRPPRRERCRGRSRAAPPHAQTPLRNAARCCGRDRSAATGNGLMASSSDAADAAFERRHEESRVTAEAIDVFVIRHDDDTQRVGSGGSPERRRTSPERRARGRGPRSGPVHPRPGRGSLQERLEVEGCGGRHVAQSLEPKAPRIFLIIADVEYPSASGMRTTRPPRASTVSRPMMASSAQSAPFTSTSG